jgi:hypothetical protein
MLTAEEIVRKLSGLPGAIGIKVLAELAEERVFEAERLILDTWGPDRADEAMELVASMVRETKGGGS